MANNVKFKFDVDGSGVHKAVQGIGSALTGLKAKIASAFGAVSVGMIAHSMLQFGDEIQTMANNLDISTDSAQRFAWAARNANVEVAALSTTMLKLDDAMARWKGGSLPASKVGFLKKLGFSDKDFDLPKDQLLFKALQFSKDKGQTPEQLSRYLSQGLGLKPSIAGKIAGARDDILNKNIPIVAESTIKRLDALGDAFSNLKNIVLKALIPAFLKAADALLKSSNKFLEYWFTRPQLERSYAEAAGKGAESSDLSKKSQKEFDRLVYEQMGLKRFPMLPGSPSWVLGEESWAKGNRLTGQAFREKDLTEAERQKMRDLRMQADKSVYGAAAVTAVQAMTKTGLLAEIQDEIKRTIEALQPKLGDADYTGPGSPSFVGPLTQEQQKMVDEYNRKQAAKDALNNRTPIEKEMKYENLGDLGGNQFVKIGGMFGADIQYRIYRASLEANQLLAQIVENTSGLGGEDNGNGQEFPPI